MVKIFTTSRYKLNRKKFQQFAQKYLTSHSIDESIVLNIIFVGRRKMKGIAKEYKQEDVALPVLSFSYEDEKSSDEKLLGEIFVCYPQVVLLAAERDKTVDRMMEQMIEHGIDNLINS